MTSKEALEILEKAWHGRIDKPDYPNFDDINEALTTIKEDEKEKDRLFNQLYLATEENKVILKQMKRLEKKQQLLLDRLIDYANRLGIPIDYKKIL